MGPHDKAFKKLLKERGVAEALLRERLPAALVRRFVGHPEHLSESFINEALHGQVADVLLRVELEGGEVTYVYCLIEHKRTAGRFVLVQVLGYLAALYAQLAKGHRAGPLPTVVPLVIYNGDAPWSGPVRFSELLDAPARVKRLTVDFEVLLVDVGAVPAAQLSAHPTLRGGLLALKAAATPLPKLDAVLREMMRTLSHDESTLRLFLKYLMNAAGRDALPAVERAAAQLGAKEATMQTISEFIESRGYRRGTRQGLKQGLEQGQRQSAQKAVRKLLTKRFKKLPPSAERKLAEADTATLDRWFDAALTAKSLGAVFASH